MIRVLLPVWRHVLQSADIQRHQQQGLQLAALPSCDWRRNPHCRPHHDGSQQPRDRVQDAVDQSGGGHHPFLMVSSGRDKDIIKTYFRILVLP